MAADTLAGAKTEVTRIFGDAGIGVTWMDPSSMESAGAFAIQILVRTRAVDGAGAVMGTALGDTHETGGSALVYYDRVLRSAHEREQGVARLLGYAMAHEMGHLVPPRSAHSPSGTMRPAWDGDDLRHIASGSLQFTAGQAGAIRVKLYAGGLMTRAGHRAQPLEGCPHELAARSPLPRIHLRRACHTTGGPSLIGLTCAVKNVRV